MHWTAAPFLSVFLTLFLIISLFTFAQNYYVSNASSDDHFGTSADSPISIANLISYHHQPENNMRPKLCRNRTGKTSQYQAME